MHHKKTVTDAVRAANRANSKFSPGPTTNVRKVAFEQECCSTRHTCEKGCIRHSPTTG
jgi:hypothetical protein